jgi:hypothetical protein
VSGAPTAIAQVERAQVGGRDIALIDLVDRLLGAGVVVQGDITLAAADIDLVKLALRLVVGSVDTLGSHSSPPKPG